MTDSPYEHCVFRIVSRTNFSLNTFGLLQKGGGDAGNTLKLLKEKVIKLLKLFDLFHQFIDGPGKRFKYNEIQGLREDLLSGKFFNT